MKNHGSVTVKIMQGNEACVEGAIFAGCRFFAGYPITPASEIAELMSVRLPQVGGVFMQMEDELASICSVIGAAWGGVKACTASSGPGISLMQEGVGGHAEEEAAEYLSGAYRKPVVAYIAGQTAPEGKHMGHAGAIIRGSSGSAYSKMESLRRAGAYVATTVDEALHKGDTSHHAVAKASAEGHHHDPAACPASCPEHSGPGKAFNLMSLIVLGRSSVEHRRTRLGRP